MLTAGYFELSLVSVAFDTVALMLLGRKVEPIWGAAEFIKFVMVRTLPRLALMRSVVLGPPLLCAQEQPPMELFSWL